MTHPVPQTPGTPAPAAAGTPPTAAIPATPPLGVAGAHTPATASPAAGTAAGGPLSGEGDGPPALVVVVLGTPAPQGSKRHVGRGVMVESSKKVRPWREAVKYAARDLIAVAGETGRLTAGFPLDGPLVVEFCFTLTRPKSAPKSRVHPDRMPDLSKLIRSTEDAFTDVGVWADDARIVAYHRPRKVYAGSADPDALHVPGAVIRVWAIEHRDRAVTIPKAEGQSMIPEASR